MIPKKEEIDRIKELAKESSKTEKERVFIISDDKQYSVRIPKRFGEAVSLDVSKDIFEFILEIPPLAKKGGEITLKGRLVKNGRD